MSTLTKFITPQLDIGDFIAVTTGYANNGATIPNTLGRFVKTGAVYKQADYPELYNRIGLIGANTFTRRDANIAPSKAFKTIAYGNGTFVYGTLEGWLGSSSDGINWTRSYLQSNHTIFDIVYNNGNFFAVASFYDAVLNHPTLNYQFTDPVIAYSSNGVTWTEYTFESNSRQIFSITYGNGLYVIGGGRLRDDVGVNTANGFIATSSDPTNSSSWTYRTTNMLDGEFVRGITYGNGKFVCYTGYQSENANPILTSTDGITWERSTSNTSPESWTSYTFYAPRGDIIYGNNIFMLVSDDLVATPYISSDGITWNISNSGDLYIESISYANGFFIASGQYENEHAISRDGINWQTISAGIENGTRILGVVYGDNKYVAIAAEDRSPDYEDYLLTANDLTKLESSYLPYDLKTEFYVPRYLNENIRLIPVNLSNNSAAQVFYYVRAK